MTRTMEIKSKDQRRIEQLEAQNLNLYESVALIYERQLEAEINNYEALAELYELILGGGI